MKIYGLSFKLLLMVGIPVVTLVALGLYGIVNTRSTFAHAENSQRAMFEITRPLNELRQLSLLMVIAPDEQLQQKFDENQQRATKQLNETVQKWAGEPGGAQERSAFEEFQASWNDYQRLKDVTVDKVRNDYREEAFINAIEAEQEQFARTNEKLEHWMSAKVGSAAQRYEMSLWIYGIVIALATAFSAGIGLVTARSIFRPVELLKNAATRIAGGAQSATIGQALEERIVIPSQNEFSQLADAFNQMVENLRSAMLKVSEEQSRTKAVLNSTADGIITVSDRGEVRSFNSAAERLLGYQAADVLGRNVSKVAPWLDAGSDGGGAIWSAPKGSELPDGEREVQAVAKDGKQVPIALRVSEMEYLGERSLIATLQDITDRKQAQQQRQRIAESIRDAVRRLTTASRHILTGTGQQLSGTQQSAASVSQTLSTVEEVSQIAQQSAERADVVSESARRSDEVGKSGRDAVEASMAAINGVKEQVESIAETILSLAEQAQAIGEITSTVSDIAEQTNVLALNAAVEASRAGEHGKGFAVVAGEVKSLAEQAKKATNQVRQILGQIQKATNNAVLSTEQGTKAVGEAGDVVRQAGETIASLSNTLADSARAASQISASARQQATGVSQLNESMRNIEEITNQNVTSIKQIEQAAKNLKDVSDELASLTADQKVD